MDINLEEEGALYRALCHHDKEDYDLFNITLDNELTIIKGEVCIEFHIEGDNQKTYSSYEAYYHLKDEDVRAILDGSISKERLEALNKDIDAFAERLIDELAFDLQKELDDIKDKKKLKEHEEDKWEDNLDNFPHK